MGIESVEESAQSQIAAMNGGANAGMVVARCWALFGQSDPALLSRIMPYIIHVHGKFFRMENGEEPTIRYEELIRTLVRGGYQGFVSSEYEGHQFSGDADSFAQVRAQQAMVKRYVARYH